MMIIGVTLGYSQLRSFRVEVRGGRRAIHRLHDGVAKIKRMRIGDRRIDRHNDNPYADRWFARTLR